MKMVHNQVESLDEYSSNPWSADQLPKYDEDRDTEARSGSQESVNESRSP
jgi:hypothetical protein